MVVRFSSTEHCFQELQWPTGSGRTEADVTALCEESLKPYENLASCQVDFESLKKQCINDIQVIH